MDGWDGWMDLFLLFVFIFYIYLWMDELIAEFIRVFLVCEIIRCFFALNNLLNFKFLVIFGTAAERVVFYICLKKKKEGMFTFIGNLIFYI